MNENNAGKRWKTSSEQWSKVKHIVREKRKEPTEAENLLWKVLRNKKLKGIKFRRQHSLDRFIVDIYSGSLNLIIEVDGEIHDYTKEYDEQRQTVLQELGYTVIRFTNEEVINSLEEVIEKIKAYIP